MLKDSSNTLRVGDPAPDFSLPTFDRRMVRLADFRRKRLVLIFIRGTW